MGGVTADTGPVEVFDGTESGDEALRKWARNAARALRALKTAESSHGHNSSPSPSVFSLVRWLSAVSGTLTTDDPTTTQVHAQVRAFACLRLEVGVLPAKHRQDLRPERTRIFSAEKLCDPRTIAWLRRMNALDHDIFCRPARREDGFVEPLVFVDDLSREAVAKMCDDGLPLAICVESSPNRFHGWVRVSDRPISRDEAQAIAQVLARDFGGDPAAASWNQYGRLAGFTNRKQSRRTARGAPFALLRSASPDIAPAGAAFLGEIRGRLEQAPRWRLSAPEKRIALKAFPPLSSSVAVAFSEARGRIGCRRADGSRDDSAADYGAACNLLERGIAPEQIIVALLNCSPGIFDRHRDAVEYARRTIGAAQSRPAGEQATVTPTLPTLRPR